MCEREERECVSVRERNSPPPLSLHPPSCPALTSPLSPSPSPSPPFPAHLLPRSPQVFLSQVAEEERELMARTLQSLRALMERRLSLSDMADMASKSRRKRIMGEVREGGPGVCRISCFVLLAFVRSLVLCIRSDPLLGERERDREKKIYGTRKGALRSGARQVHTSTTPLYSSKNALLLSSSPSHLPPLPPPRSSTCGTASPRPCTKTWTPAPPSSHRGAPGRTGSSSGAWQTASEEQW